MHELTPGEMEFKALNEAQAKSKTILQENGSIYWEKDDQIDIYTGVSHGVFTSTNNTPSAETTFRGTMEGFSWNDKNEFWAVYPATPTNSFSNQSVSITVSDIQIAEEGSFHKSHFPSIARTTSSNLYFYNVCGGIRFKITENDVIKVTFRGKNNEVLAGVATVGFSDNGKPTVPHVGAPKTELVLHKDGNKLLTGQWYYIVSLPRVLSNGYELILEKANGETAIKDNSNPVEIKRSIWGDLSNVDAGLEYRNLQADIENERLAMLQIWRSLNGENWEPDYWDPYITWKEENPISEWTGLEFNESGTLKSIIINTDIATGTLPDVFDAFKDLERLVIIGGTISGDFPASIGKLSHLQELEIWGALTGRLPDMFELSNLRRLSLYGAKFTSGIPNSIGALQNLEHLSLYRCGLTGCIPEEIGNLSKLKSLCLSTNYLEGHIPSSVCNLTNIISLDLSSNLLTGELPLDLGNLNVLEELDLRGHSTLQDFEDLPYYKNTFSGELPPSMANMKNLRSLTLAENDFSGQLPDWIWHLPNLKSLDLSFNGFSGTLSAEIGYAQELMNLNLCTNNLTGQLPNEIWTLKNLRVIVLSNYFNYYGIEQVNRNSLNGHISSNIANLKYLEEFSIANCDFTGDIPLGIASLDKLTVLKISNNSLTGTIPDAIKDLPNLNIFWCYNNKLSGFISDAFIKVMAQRNQNSIMNWIINDQKDGFGFTYQMYESTDYSKDKTVKQLRKATLGKGINIVLMGDAFVDKDIQDGTYDTVMELMCDALFEVEPFKSFEYLFNVYEIILVSKNNTDLGETALEIKPDPLYIYPVNREILFSIIDDVIPGLNPDDLTVSIACTMPSVREGCCLFVSPEGNESSSLGLGIAITHYDKNDMDSFQETIRHEVIGHGFGKLADEYSENGLNTSLPESKKSIIESHHDQRWYVNIDVSSDPNSILWKHFLTNPSYVSSGTGIFEGGWHYHIGVWRPSFDSIMRSSNVSSEFNAPSREAIYRRIHEIAYGSTWSYSYEDFLLWDTKNLRNNSTEHSSMRSSARKHVLSNCVKFLK